MELVKPDPLIIDGKAQYSLTTYDPVNVEVDVPALTEEDVDYAYALAIMQAGGKPRHTTDDQWIAEHFPGVHNQDELHESVREQVWAMHQSMVEEQKATACADALAHRLAQRVPASQVQRVRHELAQAFTMDLQHEGLRESDFLRSSGMTPTEFQEMLDEQARINAEGEAALDAWATHYRLQVEDAEIPMLLGIAPQDAERFMSELRRSGDLEHVRTVALRAKALNDVVATCSCTYHHESPAPEQSQHPHLRLV